MSMGQPNFKSKSLNTDSKGFRMSENSVGHFYGFDNFESFNQGNSLVFLGASFVFGVGASSDSNTINSQVNSIIGKSSVNMGVRGYTSTQELLLVIKYLDKIKGSTKLIWSSSLNDLSIALKGPTAIRIDGLTGYFGHKQLLDELFKATYGSIATRQSNLFYRLKDKAKNITSLKENDVERSVDYSFKLWAKNATILKSILEPLGIDLLVVLQPVLGWNTRSSHPIELVMHQRDLQMDDSIKKLTQPHIGHQYNSRVKSFLSEHSISVLDLNDKMNSTDFSSDSIFFYDYCHLTDYGYNWVAKQIVKEMI